MSSELSHQLNHMICGYWISQTVYVVAKLGIADLVQAGPRHVDNLARESNTRSDLLFRVLRAAASLGLFAETEPRTFAQTPLSDLLRSDHPGKQRSLTLMMGEEHYHVYGKLLEVLHTGANAFETLFGAPVFEWLAQHPAQGQTFDEAMTGIHGTETAAVVEAYDFAGINVVADVGGGNGSKLQAILQRHPRLRGVLFDQPQVVDRAEPLLRQAGLAERVTFARGNFFESVPSGADAYLMRHIIHDWNDEQSLTILRNCYRAMPKGGKLLLVESVIPPGNDPFFTKFLDLTMMLIPGGKERTEAEYRTLYEQAGFEWVRIVPTASEISVIEGIKR